ncbi:hypothetical protein AB0I99_14785 [Streptomyces spongiicola]|uniref:hypothetical protein n=1 Tax=Streptomyces spongiicola TaxID=1690221 RepID=UPI00340B68C3
MKSRNDLLLVALRTAPVTVPHQAFVRESPEQPGIFRVHPGRPTDSAKPGAVGMVPTGE